MRRFGLWLALLLGILGVVACGTAASSDGSGDDALDGSEHRKADAGSGHGQDGGSDGGTRSSDAGGSTDGGDRGSDSGVPPSDGGTARGAYVLHETFNAMTTGAAPASPWTSTETSGGAVSVTETPFAADKSVILTKPAGTGESALSVDFPPQSGRVVFEAKVLTRETAGFKAIPYIYDAAGNAVASVSFQDGSIQTHVGSTITTVQSFVAGEWYRVRVVVDTGAGRFDLYIDGERVLAAQALRTASTSVARLSYYLDSTSAGTLRVDNVKVYTEAAFIGAPPAPVFDARSYGAVGDGRAMDTAAIQQAVDAAAGA